jgi:hypothetical protein
LYSTKGRPAQAKTPNDKGIPICQAKDESMANLREDLRINFQDKPANRLASITGITRVRTAKLQPVFDAAFHAADPDE